MFLQPLGTVLYWDRVKLFGDEEIQSCQARRRTAMGDKSDLDVAVSGETDIEVMSVSLGHFTSTIDEVDRSLPMLASETLRDSMISQRSLINFFQLP